MSQLWCMFVFFWCNKRQIRFQQTKILSHLRTGSLLHNKHSCLSNNFLRHVKLELQEGGGSVPRDLYGVVASLMGQWMSSCELLVIILMFNPFFTYLSPEFHVSFVLSELWVNKNRSCVMAWLAKAINNGVIKYCVVDYFRWVKLCSRLDYNLTFI